MKILTKEEFLKCGKQDTERFYFFIDLIDDQFYRGINVAAFDIYDNNTGFISSEVSYMISPVWTGITYEPRWRSVSFDEYGEEYQKYAILEKDDLENLRYLFENDGKVG